MRFFNHMYDSKNLVPILQYYFTNDEVCYWIRSVSRINNRRQNILFHFVNKLINRTIFKKYNERYINQQTAGSKPKVLQNLLI